MNRVVIIDYQSGNLHSIAKSCEFVAKESNAIITVTSDPDSIAKADRIILPGVGAFADCASGVTPAIFQALEEAVLKRRIPYLGICVGMQLLATTGYEHGTHTGFNWIPGEVTSLLAPTPEIKIPHMGWNTLDLHYPDHPLFKHIQTGDHAYFVHSYHLQPLDSQVIGASVTYGQSITAMIVKENIAGTQFHPEKSQRTGLNFLHNFLTWKI